MLTATSLLLASAGASSCSGERPSLAAGGGVVTTTPSAPAKVATLDPRAVDVTTVATGAVPEVPIFDDPAAPEPQRVLRNPIESGGPLVFVVQRSADGWHEVLLPTAPNGSTAWVRDSDVVLARHNYRIHVRVADRRLDLYLRGRLLRQVPFGVGRGCEALPSGTYFTTELLRPANADHVYGAYAYALSGNSDDLEPFTGRDGEIGIHAADDDMPIEDETAAGCIRLRMQDIAGLVEELPMGVPVTIGP